MRVGAILLLRDGYCYQSYRWEYLRPLGTLNNAVKILEERNVDEISIIRYCRDSNNDYSLHRDLELISNIDCMTPLAFGGGIRDIQTLKNMHHLPIERILLNSVYIQKNQEFLEQAITLFGKQALIAVLPYKFLNNKFEYFHSCLNRFQQCDLTFIDKYSNEVMFYNTTLEGLNYSEHLQVLDFPFPNNKVILSGGINRSFIKKIRKLDFAAISFDNVSLHHEFNFSDL